MSKLCVEIHLCLWNIVSGETFIFWIKGIVFVVSLQNYVPYVASPNIQYEIHEHKTPIVFTQGASQVNLANVANKPHYYLYSGRESNSWPQWSRVELLATTSPVETLDDWRAVPCDVIMQVALRIWHETSDDVQLVVSVMGSMLAMIREIWTPCSDMHS